MDRKQYEYLTGGARRNRRSGGTRERLDAGLTTEWSCIEGPSFTCAHCGTSVPPPEYGTRQRNHCPRCLHSLHVDLTVGDRRSLCRGTMEPISIWIRADGETAVLHRCTRCGTIKANRIAGDDDERVIRKLVDRLRTAV